MTLPLSSAVLLSWLVVCALLACTLAAAGDESSGGARPAQPLLDFTRAVVVTPPGLSRQEQTAVRMLVEEVQERTQVRWEVVHAWPDGDQAVVAVGPAARLGEFAGPATGAMSGLPAAAGAEGFRLYTAPAERPVAVVAGNDARGVLFGIGRLLRELRMGRHRAHAPAGRRIATAPRYALRGHQLGYRPKTNSYDAWDVRQWEQYYRDLVVFGANAVELIPPRSDDDADSPHFPLPPMEMMVEMSRLADHYGLDVWVWYPAMDEDYSKPATVEFALKEWAEVLRKLPRLDALFVPGGDPGHTHPQHLMPMLEKQAASVRRLHPEAEIWVAPQGFGQEWMDEFLRIMRTEPPWLTGIVFGPQVRLALPKLRELIPARYPIRHYPDITHSRQCQYPVPDWDQAYAVTEAREGINPRPTQMADIFRHTQPHTMGFLTYSEGCNDDVNKCVWSLLGWDPNTDLVSGLREYGRYYIGDAYADSFAQGLFALERNWIGPLGTNTGVYTTLQQFQALERTAPPAVRSNWRFQQALYRAYYDAYVRARLLNETELENRAMEALRLAPQIGAAGAMARAEALLERAVTEPVARDWRARVFELAEALFQSIRMQLSVDRYQAIAVGRGANLDTVDIPLNSRGWLMERFTALRALPDEAARLTGLAAILEWTNPGPGGFYDELGNPSNRPHLVLGKGAATDPQFWETALTGFSQPPSGRISWGRDAQALHDGTLNMRYTGLDPGARYRLRVVYSGDIALWKVRLRTGTGVEIHPYLSRPQPVQPIEFAVPTGAVTDSGELTLSWNREPGIGGNGRGCQVSEVWLIRE